MGNGETNMVMASIDKKHGKRGRSSKRVSSAFFSPASLLLLSFIATLPIFIPLFAATPPVTSGVSTDSGCAKVSRTNSGSGSSGDGSGHSILLPVREDFCYGIVLTRSFDNDTDVNSIVRFTFTYNSSLQTGNRVIIYDYISDGNLEGGASNSFRVIWDSAGYYDIASSAGESLCRLNAGGVETYFNVEYIKITATTRVASESGSVLWTSGYEIGTGGSAMIRGNAGSGGLESGELNTATAVALAVVSLTPFFILLPEATKRVCQAVDEEGARQQLRGGKGSGQYAKILAVFTPLLCIGVVLLSVTIMLNALHLGS